MLEDRSLLALTAQLIADINQVGDINSLPAGYKVTSLVLADEMAYFVSEDRLWKTDGTSENTSAITDPGLSIHLDNNGLFAPLDNLALFIANDGVHGSELWRSDGTKAGTFLLKDIIPGLASLSILHNPKNVAGKVFFEKLDLVSNHNLSFYSRELWVTDGTETGTRLLMGGTPDSPISGSVSVGNTLFFVRNDGVTGRELWRSDGTESGTVLVKDISNGATGSTIASMTNVNGALFFSANDGVSGTELWKSDGTQSGTVMVKDIYSGAAGSGPSALININSTLYFFAYDGVNHPSLWKSDGTADGTVRIASIRNDDLDPKISQLTVVNNILYFSAIGSGDPWNNYRELWRSNGTEAGTFMVKDIRPGTRGSQPEQLINVNNTLFFVANDGVSGFELWRSDGTEGGTVLVRDIVPGPEPTYPTSIHSLMNLHGTLLFGADSDGINGAAEIWKSDGTKAGTVLVESMPLVPFGAASFYGQLNGKLIFTADTNGTGSELWVSDGMGPGTYRLPKAGDFTAASSPGWPSWSEIELGDGITTVNGWAYFPATDGEHGIELWKSDGTPSGTSMVKDIVAGPAGSFPKSLVNVNGTAFFVANSDQVWKSDGTAEGTRFLMAIGGGGPSELVNVNGTLFFRSAEGSQLWKSDGTPHGTVMVKGFSSTVPPNTRELTAVGGTLYFRANDLYTPSDSGDELWKSDGTAEGTVILNYLPIDYQGLKPSLLTNVNGTLFFEGDDRVHGRELWKTDGTVDGTGIIKDIKLGSDSSQLAGFFNDNGVLYFFADDGASGKELWRSDGTAEGTKMVRDIRVGPDGSSSVFFFGSLNGSLYFVANDGVHGEELWKTDGTEAGTVLVKDIHVGDMGSGVSNLASVGEVLFFTANDGINGTELWASIGGAVGTVPAQDIFPGFLGSNPSYLASLDGALVFSADDGVHGKELWSVRHILVSSEAGPQSFDGFAHKLFSDVPPGGSTDLEFVVSNDNQSLFVKQPAIDATGRLTFTPTPNSFGVATVTVIRRTGAEGEQGGDIDLDTTTFTISVTPETPWQNDLEVLDVNNDFEIAPDDIVLIINYLNTFDWQMVMLETVPNEPFIDSNGDNVVAPDDALEIINYLNSVGGAQEPERTGFGAQESGSMERQVPAGSRQMEDEWLSLLAEDGGRQNKRRR